MSLVIPSPNMSLPIPIVGVEIGPDYATDVNNSLTLVDQHDHSPGRGLQITPAGLNINDNLDFKGHNALNLVGVTLEASTVASSSLQTLSVAPGAESPVPLQDLWYTDSAGNKIQITEGGIVKTVAASIPGESYAFGTFFWKQTQDALPTTPADFDIGSITLRPNTAATTDGTTISPNAALVGSNNLILPLLPAVGPSTSPAFMTIDDSGNILTSTPQALGITNSMIANATISAAKLAPGVLASANSFIQITTYTTAGTFVVPTNVTQILIATLGGGGGGGGGSGSGAGASQAGGGGGGEGVTGGSRWIAVTPGETLTITPGAAGAAGTGATGLNVAGGAGGAGGNSTISRGATVIATGLGGRGGGGGSHVSFSSTALGGTGGGNPTAGTTVTGAAGVLETIQVGFAGFSGGNGGGYNGSPTNGGAGYTGTGFYLSGFNGGAAGAAGGGVRGGGGGGGMSFYAAGGAGGAGGTSAGTAGTLSAGGGGGGGDKNGGAGGTGTITVSWIAPL